VFDVWAGKLRPVSTKQRELALRWSSELRAIGIDPGRFVSGSFGREGRTHELHTAFVAGARSYIRFRDWCRQRHGSIDAPGLPPGPHLCLVCSTTDILSRLYELREETERAAASAA
jgi:hypothetical protein